MLLSKNTSKAQQLLSAPKDPVVIETRVHFLYLKDLALVTSKSVTRSSLQVQLTITVIAVKHGNRFLPYWRRFIILTKIMD